MKKYVGFIFIVSILFSVQAKAFETDDAYNRQIMANKVFYQADKIKDNKLTEADGGSWDKYKHLDANTDAVVSRDEFFEGVELPYPRWDGEVQRNIVCKRVGDAAVLLDIYAPLVKKYDKAPVFYYTHGGGWSGGTKEITDGVRPLFEALSKEGFVCVSVMYRLVKMHDPKDPVLMRDCAVDCRDGLRFLEKHETELGLDMDRVVVFGSSAGGHLAQLLTWSDPDDFAGDPILMPYKVELAAGVSWFGPCDFRDPKWSVSDGVKDKFAPDFWAARITKVEGKSIFDHPDEKTRAMLAEVSPVVYLSKNSAPLLHMHGDQDAVISRKQAYHLKEQAAAVGAPVEIQMVKGAGHGWWNKNIEPSRKEAEQMTVDYILKQVAGISE